VHDLKTAAIEHSGDMIDIQTVASADVAFTDMSVDLTAGIDGFMPDFHLPIYTILLSTTRELKLLNDRKTSLETSIKNIALDAVGTGGGSLSGSIIGIKIGTFCCPGAGTIIGAVVGAIAGAIGGRTLTNKIKRGDLDRAIEDYRYNFNRMEQETSAAARAATVLIHSYCSEARKDYHLKIGKAPTYSEDKAAIRNQAKRVYKRAYQSIRASDDRLCKSLRKAISTIEKDRWYHRLLGLKVREAVRRGLEGLGRSLKENIKEADSLMPSDTELQNDPLGALNKLGRVPLPQTSSLTPVFASAVENLRGIRATHLMKLLAWTHLSSAEYQAAIVSLSKRFQPEVEKLNSVTGSWKRVLADKERNVKQEMGKLGL
jgi:hypothetical protein